MAVFISNRRIREITVSGFFIHKHLVFRQPVLQRELVLSRNQNIRMSPRPEELNRQKDNANNQDSPNYNPQQTA